jgi:hypothetical protein
MPAYNDADVQAATKATIGHRGEQCQTGWLCQCGFTGDTASLDDHFASLVLDAVAPAIAARAKAEALREHAADLMAAVADFSEISWERLNNESVARLALNRADEIERATP